VAISRNGRLLILDEKGREKEYFPITYGSVLLVKEGSMSSPARSSPPGPYSFIILSEIGGTVAYKDIIEGENVREEIDKITGKAQKIVVETISQEKRVPQFVITSSKGEEKRYYLPEHSHLMVADGQEIHPGDILGEDSHPERQDQGHHRRPPPRPGALRGAQAPRSGRRG